MSRPPMVLTGPQAVAIGVTALVAWTIREPICRVARFLYWGPDFFRADEDDDWVDFVGANPDLFLGPVNGGDRG